MYGDACVPWHQLAQPAVQLGRPCCLLLLVHTPYLLSEVIRNKNYYCCYYSINDNVYDDYENSNDSNYDNDGDDNNDKDSDNIMMIMAIIITIIISIISIFFGFIVNIVIVYYTCLSLERTKLVLTLRSYKARFITCIFDYTLIAPATFYFFARYDNFFLSYSFIYSFLMIFLQV